MSSILGGETRIEKSTQKRSQPQRQEDKKEGLTIKVAKP